MSFQLNTSSFEDAKKSHYPEPRSIYKEYGDIRDCDPELFSGRSFCLLISCIWKMLAISSVYFLFS